MPKIKKVRRKKTYKYSINRKKLWQKSKKLPNIPCSAIKKAWQHNKSTKSNLNQMGLAYDANDVMRIPSAKEIAKTDGKLSKLLFDEENQRKSNNKQKKVVLELEAEATAPREKRFRLPKGEVQFITYLMDKYGDDYGAMARDKKNYYQLTWRKIKNKIDVFKNIPEQYGEYLVEKGEIVLDDPTPLKETKRQIGLENLKQHCTSKKPKKGKKTIKDWIEEELIREEEMAKRNEIGDEEDDDDGDFNTSNTLVDDANANVKRPLEPEKKMKLFPDDDKTSKKQEKRRMMLEKRNSSESEDSDEEMDDDDNSVEFKNLSDLSDDGLSDEDVLDDGTFVTDSDDDSD